ncbi:MAG: hypothetical protein DRP87_11890 [Spirochaetes bacterium]|nr:MAG: hypothetical protein DRP87_11890 [Spirochaetota bacterium]
MPVWTSFALMGAGLAAFFIEMFVPAGGLIGIGGGASIIAAVVLAYVHHGTAFGTLVLVLAVISTPLIVALGLKVFPRTFIGKRFILKETQEHHTGYTTYSSDKYANLLHAEGVAITDLRPSGMIKIGEERYSVVTGGEYIEKGTKVKVVKTEGSRVVVRRIQA